MQRGRMREDQDRTGIHFCGLEKRFTMGFCLTSPHVENGLGVLSPSPGIVQQLLPAFLLAT